MRRSEGHEYRQAYTAQAVVCAEGTQLILATNLTNNPSDAPSFAATILSLQPTLGLPRVVLADAGFAGADGVAQLKARSIEPLGAVGRSQPQRLYDFRPPPEAKIARQTVEWVLVTLAYNVRRLNRLIAA